MLKEFAEYLASVKENKIYEINGDTFSDNHLHRIAPFVPRPAKITVNGLDSVAALIANEFDRIPPQSLPLFVRVIDARHVEVYSGLGDDMERYDLYYCICDAPEFKLGWMDYNTAIIKLRSMFVPNEGQEYLVGLLSRISKEDGVTTMDNGVTQQVEARSGISLKAKETIRPRVKLIPYRTFTEIEQPESEFLVRVDSDGQIGFFEADGGAWQKEAKGRIMEYLYNTPSPIHPLVNSGKVVVMA